MLFALFEPLFGPHSIAYANGQDWEDRRKWLYEPFKGPYLESYVSHFVEVLEYLVYHCVNVFDCLYIRYPMRLLVDGHSLRRILLWNCKKNFSQ